MARPFDVSVACFASFFLGTLQGCTPIACIHNPYELIACSSFRKAMVAVLWMFEISGMEGITSDDGKHLM